MHSFYQFKNLLPNYVIGASGGIFLYDISRFYSLIHLEDWLNVIDKATDQREHRMPILLVGSKSDLALEGNRTVDKEYALKYGGKYNVFDFFECSSKTGENVDLIFTKIARKMLESAELL